MNKTISRCLFISLTSVLFIFSIVTPWALDSDNSILDNFISQGGLLSFLGVLVTITLAWTANLHLELNKMENKVNSEVFKKTRQAIKKSSYSMIISLVVAIVLISVKSLFPDTGISQAMVNSLNLLLVFFDILVLIDITQTVFAI